MMKRIAPQILALLILAVPLWGQNVQFDVSHSTDWQIGEMSTQISFYLADAGIRLPTGRFMAEETLRDAYPRLLRQSLMSLRVDSSSTIADLVERGELSLEELDALCLAAEQTAPSLSTDLSRMSARYKIFMERVGSLFGRQGRVVEAERPLIPVPTVNYTGIVIFADEELPIRGRMTAALLEPCLFPRIWDTDMNLFYERNMSEQRPVVRYTTRENVLRPTPSGLEGELAELAGPNPLRIIARGAFGISPTDPVIDRQDALLILSSENNRRLLRQGRVILVLDEQMLTVP
ncbi:MAG: polymerase [Treponema sp.]|nr:polymerase [Treponema sp.]